MGESGLIHYSCGDPECCNDTFEDIEELVDFIGEDLGDYYKMEAAK